MSMSSVWWGPMASRPGTDGAVAKRAADELNGTGVDGRIMRVQQHSWGEHEATGIRRCEMIEKMDIEEMYRRRDG